MRGLDQTLRVGLGESWSLHALMPSSTVVRCSPEWQRYRIEADEVPDNGDHPRSFRSALIHATSEETRLEVDYDASQKMLCSWCDQGSAEWNSRCWLHYVKNLRVLEFFDVIHRRDNNAKLAIKKSGCNAVRLLGVLCMNFL